MRLTVIGVLADSAPLHDGRDLDSQPTLAPAFGDRVRRPPTCSRCSPGVDAEGDRARLESAFLANGMQADSLWKLLHDAVSASLTFDRLIMGFMGLGLDRRRRRARRDQRPRGRRAATADRRPPRDRLPQRMVQLSFLLESSFIALTVDRRRNRARPRRRLQRHRRRGGAAGLENLSFDVPWLTLAVIFLAVYAVALLTTLAPARRASRVFPAEALRYQ